MMTGVKLSQGGEQMGSKGERVAVTSFLSLGHGGKRVGLPAQYQRK